VRIQTWDLVSVVGFLVFVIIRGVFEQRTKGNVKVVSRRDGRELTVMAVLGVGTFLLPILYLFTPWLGFADYRLPTWTSWCGTGLMSGALWLFWRSHAALGENWSITLEVRKGHQLITHGVYRLVRHPMYASICFLAWLRDCSCATGWPVGPRSFRLSPCILVGRLARSR